MLPGPSDSIQPGTRLRTRDAFGEWREMVATTEVEGCRTHSRRHNFAGVYVRRPDHPEDEGVFWPLEDVEVIS